ncbi:protealysin inhibitor emfourin [Streptomyces sp. NPDC056528]|uniref:protealysin inhibitor emfourin n=1 Tax=Streptomyces sp. NPDC056528 TaxID=3345854 RepID=UPI0036807C8E
MRIRVRRTGGFAGIERSAEVDTAGRADAGVWTALTEAVLTADEGGDGSRVPDGFSYEITVDGRTVRCGDPHLTEAQRTLVARVLQEGA